MNKTCKDIIALNLVERLGPRKIMALLKETSCTEEIFSMPSKRFKEITGAGIEMAEAVKKVRESKGYAEEIAFIEKEGIHPVCLADSDYPEALKNIYDPPSVLFSKGSLSPLDAEAVAIVGARNCSLYGMRMAEKLAVELAGKGITVVSGMARGVDSAAHRGAISAGGRTIAVMGSGFRNLYPLGSAKTVSAISASGAVLTEYPSYMEPIKGNFPRRNRIISGLSKGVVVVEASEKSGALITSDFALEQGKEVFACSGHSDSATAKGSNRLIQNGAKLVMNVDDILEELGSFGSVKKTQAAKKKTENLTDEERGIWQIVEKEGPVHVDRIAEASGVEVKKISGILLQLEIKGAVKAMAGKMYKGA